MKKKTCVMFIILTFVAILFSVDIIKISPEFPLNQVLEKQDLPIAFVTDFDFEDDFLYILDGKRGVVLKVEIRSGELFSTISSKGQGPGELENASEIHINNNRMYIFDEGFMGIKVFALNGVFKNSFKLSSRLLPRIQRKAFFAVTDNKKLLISDPDPKTDTLISEYDAESGVRIRSFIKGNLSVLKDRKSILEMTMFGIRMDRDHNIYILFYLTNRIKKYSIQGELIWDERIENEFLEKDRKANKKTGVVIEGRNMSFRPQILGFDVTPNGSVIIGHFGADGGGCILGQDGKLLNMIRGGGIQNRMIQIRKNRIVCCGGFLESFSTCILPKKITEMKE